VGRAVALADADGIGAVTMRKLAGRLGVEAMSLYHHVRGKDDVLDGMVDQVFAEVAVPAPGADWQAAMRTRCLDLRTALNRHPWALGLMESRRNAGYETLRHHDAVLGCLRGAGFTIPMAAHAYALLDSYVYGFVLQEVHLPFSDGESIAEVVEELLPEDRADGFPHLTEMAREHVLRPGYAFGDEFTFGLDLVLDGLARAVEGDA
jgi:AcrR family transcriptional regulator